MDIRLNLRLRALLVLAAAMLTAAACEYPWEPVGKEEIGLGTGAPGGTDPNIVSIEGTWRRTFIEVDEFGFLTSEETTWIFEADGDATQILVTANNTLSVADTVLSIGRWRMDSVNLVIDFATPSPSQVLMTAVVGPGGQTLLLAGQEFLRVE